MPKQSIATLKAKFLTGSTPTQQDFFDLIDSFVHIDSASAVSSSVVNDAIQNYDSDLKEESVDSVVNTLGDVFKVFQGYSDGRTLNNELKWSELPGKPSEIALSWTEQTIDFYNYATHFSTFDDQTSNPENMTVMYRTMNSLRIRNQGNVNDAKKINIIDLIVLRRKFTTTGAAFHEIRGVVVGVTPKVSLHD